jgi:nitrate reductase NapD
LGRPWYAGDVNVSGILVVVRPPRLQTTLEQIDQLPGVEVHHKEPSTGRVVATIEAPTIDAEVEVLKRIQCLPAVILAEMVEHHVDVDGPDTGETR